MQSQHRRRELEKQQIQDQDQNPVAGRKMCVCLDVCVLETVPKSDEISMIYRFFRSSNANAKSGVMFLRTQEVCAAEMAEDVTLKIK